MGLTGGSLPNPHERLTTTLHTADRHEIVPSVSVTEETDTGKSLKGHPERKGTVTWLQTWAL